LDENIKNMKTSFYFVEQIYTNNAFVKILKTLHCVNVARRMIFSYLLSVIEFATTQLRGFKI